VKKTHPKKPKQSSVCKVCGSTVPLTWTPPIKNPEGESIFGHGLCSCGAYSFAIEAFPPDQPESFLFHSLHLFMLGFTEGFHSARLQNASMELAVVPAAKHPLENLPASPGANGSRAGKGERLRRPGAD